MQVLQNRTQVVAAQFLSGYSSTGAHRLAEPYPVSFHALLRGLLGTTLYIRYTIDCA